MSTLTVLQIADAMSALTVDQQLALHRALTDMIKHGRKVQALTVGSSFNIGNVVRFNAKTRGVKTIKIEKFNRAGTAVVGYEVDASGNRLPGAIRWTVANGLCSKVA